jgi:hypothetical protein
MENRIKFLIWKMIKKELAAEEMKELRLLQAQRG